MNIETFGLPTQAYRFFVLFGECMTCFSYDIYCTCTTTFGLLYFFVGVFFHSRMTGACPLTTDLIMRVDVRTTTTTEAAADRLSQFHLVIVICHFFVLGNENGNNKMDERIV